MCANPRRETLCITQRVYMTVNTTHASTYLLFLSTSHQMETPAHNAARTTRRTSRPFVKSLFLRILRENKKTSARNYHHSNMTHSSTPWCRRTLEHIVTHSRAEHPGTLKAVYSFLLYNTLVNSMSVKIQLFNTYCSPMYTAQLWWNHTVASFHRLNVAYNNVLRRLLRRPRFCSASGLFAECRIPNCKAVIRNLIFRFMTRLDLSTNSIISTILVSDIRWTSRIRRHWVKSLYVHHNLV